MSATELNDKVFRFLDGSWKVERKFKGSYSGSFSGVCDFRYSPNSESTYLYSEKGKLADASGWCYDARQTYLYRLAGKRLDVLKEEDGEWVAMHELDFVMVDGLAGASHVHLCGRDHYSVEYSVDLSAGWEIAYRVEGPRKNYAIRSVYKR